MFCPLVCLYTTWMQCPPSPEDGVRFPQTRAYWWVLGIKPRAS